jgi:hypothetical protein
MKRVILGLIIFGCLAGANARDLGQWEAVEPAIRQWYQALMQPDVPNASCCGEADAYWADEIHVREGRTYAVITDDRPDEPRGRPHVEIGTEIEIPNNKLKWDRSNPTGHGILFLSRSRFVFCFVQPAPDRTVIPSAYAGSRSAAACCRACREERCNCRSAARPSTCGPTAPSR